jgi:hypothetical protein
MPLPELTPEQISIVMDIRAVNEQIYELTNRLNQLTSALLIGKEDEKWYESLTTKEILSLKPDMKK